MANQQQVLFAETIAGMKKALKRRAYDSDSDSDVDNKGNRGQKLKKRARFARRGQLVPTIGPSSYKEVSNLETPPTVLFDEAHAKSQTVEYAGVRRSILYRNPPLLDDEGYEIDSDDDPDRVEDAIAAAAEFDPYANIRLENVLAPLTATTDLPTHPTLSKPFTSETLPDLVLKSCQMMRKENQSLWQVRHLWTTLCGDQTWAPCEMMIGPNDVELYTDDHVARHLLSLARSNPEDGPGAKSPQPVSGDAAANGGDTVAVADGDVPMTESSEAKLENGETSESKEPTRVKKPLPDGPRPDPEDIPMQNGEASPGANKETGKPETEDPSNEHAAADSSKQQGPTAGENAALSALEDPESTFVHPIFVTPDNARADRDAGLSEHEADQLRKLLALYVQKQEEVCRGAEKLHEGLLKAQRLRADVLHWSKAEAHAGVNRDMSDGEDWYDREEWGLTEDLKKGQDEEEEDTTTTGKKTTRARK
ncbi:rxt2-like protein [Sarocladium implicatum]|nr:rxt2-like protein [Sarocladium implicatum]